MSLWLREVSRKYPTYASALERIAELETLLAEPAPERCLPGLTPSEMRLLRFLLKRDVASRAQIITFLWGGDEPDTAENTVTTFIKRVRRVLSPSGVYIQTLYGVGYRIPPASKEKCLQLLGDTKDV